jgi:uncharacterized protein involved in exopolysaccharide biosynthesis
MIPLAQPTDQQRQTEHGSALGPAVFLLRHRRVIVLFALAGATLGGSIALLGKRTFSSGAKFLPQGTDVNAAGLAQAASQLGIRVPASGGVWSPAIYADLLESDAILLPLLSERLRISEEGGREANLAELLDVETPNASQLPDRTMRALRDRVLSVRENKAMGAVELTVITRWPSVSLQIADALVKGLQTVVLDARKTQASAERIFADARADEAEAALRVAEDHLLVFLKENRALNGSPELGFVRDRLQRDVSLRQTVFTTLVQSREEARLREVRNTPVFTILSQPRLSALPVSRRAALKAALGLLGGGILGLTLAFFREILALAHDAPSEAERELLRLLDDSLPRALRPKRP